MLAVGSDANIGKMTVMLQLRDAMKTRGVRVNFAPTGQTGIFIDGWGICVDAVVADFIAGAAEAVTIQGAKDHDIVLVEGQGSILHPGYSGRVARVAARQPAARADRLSPLDAYAPSVTTTGCRFRRSTKSSLLHEALANPLASCEDDRRVAEHRRDDRRPRRARKWIASPS